VAAIGVAIVAGGAVPLLVVLGRWIPAAAAAATFVAAVVLVSVRGPRKPVVHGDAGKLEVKALTLLVGTLLVLTAATVLAVALFVVVALVGA